MVTTISLINIYHHTWLQIIFSSDENFSDLLSQQLSNKKYSYMNLFYNSVFFRNAFTLAFVQCIYKHIILKLHSMKVYKLKSKYPFFHSKFSSCLQKQPVLTNLLCLITEINIQNYIRASFSYNGQGKEKRRRFGMSQRLQARVIGEWGYHRDVKRKEVQGRASDYKEDRGQSIRLQGLSNTPEAKHKFLHQFNENLSRAALYKTLNKMLRV